MYHTKQEEPYCKLWTLGDLMGQGRFTDCNECSIPVWDVDSGEAVCGAGVIWELGTFYPDLLGI